MPDESRELLTVAEVAGELRISENGVYRLLHAGDLPHVRVGPRRYVITRAQLDAYIVASAVDPNDLEAQAANVRAAATRLAASA